MKKLWILFTFSLFSIGIPSGWGLAQETSHLKSSDSALAELGLAIQQDYIKTQKLGPHATKGQLSEMRSSVYKNARSKLKKDMDNKLDQVRTEAAKAFFAESFKKTFSTPTAKKETPSYFESIKRKPATGNNLQKIRAGTGEIGAAGGAEPVSFGTAAESKQFKTGSKKAQP